jgi:hypothetical protein
MPRIIIVKLPGFRWNRYVAFSYNDRNEVGVVAVAHTVTRVNIKLADLMSGVA